MENDKVSMAIQVSRFLTGTYATDFIAAGWYDWFCNEKSLNAKTKTLYNKIIQIMQADAGKRFNPETCYVFLKNNCPCNGPLYDSFSICDMESGAVKFWITPKSGHKVHNNEAQVCGPENKFEEPLAKGKWADVINYFKNK